jgi:hypothetical protein
MLLPLLLTLGHAAEADPNPAPVRLEAATGLHFQAFGAPYVPGVQDRRGFVMPSLQAEGEVRSSRIGLRARVGIGVPLVDTTVPLTVGLDGGLILLRYTPGERPHGEYSYGLEVGTGWVFAQHRLYGGPAFGSTRRWKVGALEGQAGIRVTGGLAYEFGTGNDWRLITAGPAMGGQIGVALTFASVE